MTLSRGSRHVVFRPQIIMELKLREKPVTSASVIMRLAAPGKACTGGVAHEKAKRAKWLAAAAPATAC